MRSRLFSLSFVLCIIPLLLCDCERACSSDQVYYTRFSITNKQTGKPYFSQNSPEVDSFRVYEKASTSSQLLPIDKRFDPVKGYVFGDINIIERPLITLYLRFNKDDFDTLDIANQITPSTKKCGLAKYLTTATFNQHLLKVVSNDTTSFATFELTK